MIVNRTNRGFELIIHPTYLTQSEMRLVGASSAVGDNEDSMDRPGSSYLWIAENHHLNREEVAELVGHLSAWVATGSLEVQAAFMPQGEEK